MGSRSQPALLFRALSRQTSSMWRLVSLGLLFASLVMLPACGEGGKNAGPGRLRLAVIPKGTQHEYWKSVHAGALAAARELGIDIEWQGPQSEGDREGQVRVVENFVNAGVQGIVLAPLDATALVRPVEEAARAGIPTVVIDSGLNTKKRVAFVATDNYQGGVLAAGCLGELLAGKGQILVLRYQEGSASTMQREQGFLDTLQKDFPGVVVLDSNQYGGDLGKARKTADAMLLAHADIDGVFCPNESTTHGMLGALQAVGKAGKVRFVGFDANAPLVLGLTEGQIDGLVLQDPVSMGRRGVEVMVAKLRGHPVEPEEHTALQLATKANMLTPDVARVLHPDLSILDK